MTTSNVTLTTHLLAKRGNTSVSSTYTGLVGELVVHTDLNAVRVQAGATAGGFLIGNDVPQTVLSSNVTLANADRGKHFYADGTVRSITIPFNANLALPIGTEMQIIANAAGVVRVEPMASNVGLFLAGNSTSVARVVGNYGVATVLKVDTNTWYINGTGIT